MKPAQAEPDDWIQLTLGADGRISWASLRVPAPEPGCSNAFGGFSGTWSAERVELVEWTAGGESFVSAYRIARVVEGRMELVPVRD